MFSGQAFLIHCNDPSRKGQRDSIVKLLQLHQISCIGIFSQPSAPTLPKHFPCCLQNLRTRILKAKANFKHLMLRDSSSTFHIRILWFRAIIRSVFSTLTANQLVSRADWRHGWVEGVVSSKHIRAWKTALENQYDFCMVFEDDVECYDFSSNRLGQLLSELKPLLNQKPLLYIDIAGGFPLEHVLPLSQAVKGDSYQYEFCGVYTNTACGYIVSRGLIESWCDLLNQHEYLSSLPIDHLINYLSLLQPLPAFSGHCRNSIFGHGSFLGSSTSWQV